MESMHLMSGQSKVNHMAEGQDYGETDVDAEGKTDNEESCAK